METYYQIWQAEKHGNVLPETEDNSPVPTDWFERENEIREVNEQQN